MGVDGQMKDYISREALEHWVREEMASLDSKEDREFVIQRWQKEIPAADVAPVVHGTWLPIVEANEDGSPYQAGVFCSVCGHPECVETNYCCYCGAVMDGGAKDAID